MFKALYMHIKPLILLLISLLAYQVNASEKALTNEVTVFNETFGWQLMGSISAVYDPSLLKGVDQEEVLDYTRASLLLDFYYKGFFIQSDHRRPSAVLDGAEIGYQLKATSKWELDIVSKTYLTGYEPKKIIDDANKDIPTLNGLSQRRVGQGIALRYSRFHDNSVFSVDVATLAPFSSPNGWVLDAFYSYVVEYRNWDVYLNTGYTFYSQSAMDYYYGINADEATAARPQHQSSSGYRVQLELFAQHPISQSWSFTGGLTQSYYSSSTKESPLVDTQHLTQVMLGVIYVF